MLLIFHFLFVRTQELSKFNEFFMEKEEDLVMLDRRLEERLDEARASGPQFSVISHMLQRRGRGQRHFSHVRIAHRL